MFITARELAARRMTAVLVLRLLAIGIALGAIIPFSSWIMEGLRDGDLLDVVYYAGRIFFSFALPVMGTAGWFLAGPLARLAVAAPPSDRCPACRYGLEGQMPSRCPECGILLTVAAESGDAQLTERQERDRLVYLRQISALVLRLMSLAGLTYAGFLMLSVWLTMRAYGTTYYGGSWILSYAAVMLFLLFVLALAPHLSIWIVPTSPHTKDARPPLPIAGLLIAAGIVTALLSAWVLSDPDQGPAAIIPLLTGIGLAIGAVPLCRGLGWGTRRTRPAERDQDRVAGSEPATTPPPPPA